MRAIVGLLALALAGCSQARDGASIYLQRFFGECTAVYGTTTDLSKVEGECGIITTMINKFNAENPDVEVSQNVVAWPGYAQLTAQVAARDPPDIVTMHTGVMSDYAAKGLIEPIDAYLRDAGISPASFTDASRRAVTLNGRIYGLPWDTHGGLFHVNLSLFKQAGLMRGGKPVLPQSAEELLQHARQFKARTGKPYLIQSLVGDPAYQTRNMYTYLMAQDAAIFPDPNHIRLTTPEARRVAAFIRRISEERLTTLNQDTPAAIASFMNGEGGIYPTGTWMIGQFEAEANTPGRPLHNSYGVYPYPRLWGRQASFVSGHAWVVPKRERSAEQRAAMARFFRFMARHNFDWARTGHLPAFRSVVASPQFKALPHREDIAPLATIGQPLPGYVQRQSAIEGLVGEEVAAAVNGQKPIDRALADAERRVNNLLAQVD
ncbi:extracellular solute-binding protein [Sphingomonas sp.]|uniref:ABC transporter substrate-binding protein n=1 Tax=Sphingomonas sp. TaxID=28214 RepID=UPI00179CFC96|nr:extracellular solute-binding protein [Sphingomonas sp.]MBA3512055.1 extracellular solute-binding protein [Sphingomonas sp.]